VVKNWTILTMLEVSSCCRLSVCLCVCPFRPSTCQTRELWRNEI